jgi:hypothetical protein
VRWRVGRTIGIGGLNEWDYDTIGSWVVLELEQRILLNRRMMDNECEKKVVNNFLKGM